MPKSIETPHYFTNNDPFSTAQMLMGMDGLFLACCDRPKFVHKLLALLTKSTLNTGRVLKKNTECAYVFHMLT